MPFVDKSIEVHADIREVYACWSQFTRFPEFMEIVERITVLPEEGYHWVAVVDRETVEWDVIVTEHVPQERIVWRALDGREAGQVRFEKRGANRTLVHYQIMYNPEIWGRDSHKLIARRVESDLNAFKEMIEPAAAKAA